MKNHIKAQHEGKHTLSPERKVAKQIQEEIATQKENYNQVKEVEKTLEGDIITIPRLEIEHLQDTLLQTGKDKENLIQKVAESSRRMQNLEKDNSKLEQENQYFKN